MEGNLKENSPDLGSSISNSNISSSDTEWHTGYIQGNTFSYKKIEFRIINGMAIFEGDIILARTPKEIEKLKRPPIAEALEIKGKKFRWPHGEIPYVIQSTLQNKDRVTDTIQHWESRTSICFVKRIDSNAPYYQNYDSFEPVQALDASYRKLECSVNKRLYRFL